jgi:hypothetical protein
MKLTTRIALIFAAALLIGAGSAKADTMLYFTLTGPDNLVATFELAKHPSVDPLNVDPGFGFTITPVDLVIDGATSSDVLAFYSGPDGGFAALSPDFMTEDFSLSGPQIYKGSEWAPTFSTDGMELSDWDTGTPGYYLNISRTNNVPEPRTLVLLAAGLLPLGLLAKRLL